MAPEWRSAYLDAVLVGVGMVLLVGYHARLAYRVWKAPCTTQIGLYHITLQAWVHLTLKDALKNGLFVVQTMRNSIMSSSMLAAAAITMTTMVGIVLTNDRKSSVIGKPNTLMFGERGLSVGREIKLAALVPCFLVASYCYVRSATCYSNVSLLLSAVSHPSMSLLVQEHFEKSLIWASLFRCVGTRALCVSFPLLIWLYGPVPMFCSSVLTIIVLVLQDSIHHTKFAKLPLPESFSPWDDAAAPEGSPLIGIGPVPPDSLCVFCPHG